MSVVHELRTTYLLLAPVGGIDTRSGFSYVNRKLQMTMFHLMKSKSVKDKTEGFFNQVKNKV